MRPPPDGHWLRKTGHLPSLLTAIFVIIVLLVFNLSNWRVLGLLQQGREEDLTRRLQATAETLSAALSPTLPLVLREASAASVESVPALLEDFSDTSAYEQLQAQLQNLTQSAGLSQASLLTREGYVVADTTHRTAPGDVLLYTIDIPHLLSARDGISSMTQLYDLDGRMYKRAYVPLPVGQPMPDAILMCAISADFIETMERARKQILRLWAASSILLVLLGFWLYRTFRYVVRLEHSAMQGARVEAMGALAAGVAHELRNPLAIIRVLAEEAKEEVPPESRVAQNAADIVAETQRLSELVTHFLSLSQVPRLKSGGSLELKPEIERVVQLVRRSRENPPDIEIVFPGNAIYVRTEEPSLRQVLLNLLLNAQDAVPQLGGRIVIEVRERKNQAEIRVIDNGPGIAAKDLPRIFEPFFTTKTSGTGLGLPISSTIAENLGGALTLKPGKAGGTEAVLMLPMVSV